MEGTAVSHERRGDFIAYIKRTNPTTKSEEKIGVMLADKVDGKLRIGYSAVNYLKGDVFDKEFGIRTARGRMSKNRVLVKDRLAETLTNFAERAKKYFQDAEVDFAIVTFSQVEKEEKEQLRKLLAKYGQQ